MPEIYIAGFPPETTEMQLAQLVIECGLVKTIQIVRDKRTGNSKGAAFIDMMDKQGAENAVSMLNQSSFCGQMLIVRLAEEKPERHSKSPTMGNRPQYTPYVKVERPADSLKRKRPRKQF